MIRAIVLACCLSPFLLQVLRAGDLPSPDVIRDAIGRAIPLLEKGAAGSANERKCFTCHNQALPVMALSEAKSRGFAIDEANFTRQVNHTFKHLERGRKNYLEGKGQGGQVITAGYALRALEAGQHKADEITSAVANYLLAYQKDADHWRKPGSRPPSSGSDFTTTYLALLGLDSFGSKEQQAKIKARRAVVRKWLLKAKPKDTEDLAFRIRALAQLDRNDDEIQTAIQANVKQLVASQREDGGWAQTKDMTSDAYATGSVLVVLVQAGGVERQAPAIQKGLSYLLSTQQADGSWHVKTRAKPFQKYFESGFPHENDQFISIAASSWAAMALANSLSD